MPTLVSNASDLVEKISANKWWQGAVVEASSIEKESTCQYWVLISQTCNLFNLDFEQVPLVEFMGGNEITECNSGLLRGEHPRRFHSKALLNGNEISLELFSHERRWISREYLATNLAPQFFIQDLTAAAEELAISRVNWLEQLASWVARSYTRLALPGEFNDALAQSKIKDIFESTLFTRNHNDLYGLFLALDRDSEEPWNGQLGQMPGPYLLELVLVTIDNVDPEPLLKKLRTKLFEDKVKDPSGEKVTRAELGLKNGIRIIPSAVQARTMSQVTLADLGTLIRYTFVDHLSSGSQ